MKDSKFEKVLLDEGTIRARVIELGLQLTRDYAGKTPTLICVLRGASSFFADLSREIELPIFEDFIAISSYGDKTSTSGEVKLVKDVAEGIEGKDVVLVEDIVDSGNSMKYIKELFAARKPASIKVCAFLDKPSRRTVDFQADYVGFTVPDEFLVGYGLDYGQRFRNLKDVRVLAAEVYGGKK